MDIGLINSTNSIQNLNNLNNNSNVALNKTQLKYSIDDFKSNSSEALTVSRSSILKSEFSQDIQSINDGIAKSQISQTSIDKLQDFMKNIQNKLENNQNYENKNDLKQSINEDLRNFNQVAYETKFKKENIIATNYYDDKKSIDINTKNANFSIEKPNTPTYANEIFELSNNSDLNNSTNLEQVSSKVRTSSNQLKNTYDDFTEFGNKLEFSAKETIKAQVDLYNENKINKDRNFGQESTDFSKTNVNANLGYLAASQANIVQAQSVRLLS